MNSLAKISRKKHRYDKKGLGAIKKREYENDVVWITLQAHQLKWKKITIKKVKKDGTDLMSILYTNPKHRNIFFKRKIGQD